MMEAGDERQVAMRSIVPEIRAGHIELVDVSFRYPEAGRDALSGLSPSRSTRVERIGIIGRVASGKSTLGRVLCGLYAPTKARCSSMASTAVSITRTSCARRSASSARIAEVFSGSVRDNLMLGAANATDAQLIDAVVRSGADIFLVARCRGLRPPGGRTWLAPVGRSALLAGACPRAGSARPSCCSSMSRPVHGHAD